ncbi:MAG: 2-oxo acid dehydrogenase subunit E2 [Actinomycetota bacterium]|nr:2-oxo acid dehydrogenase subunit E2 [Actinomycetota bacterium]
MSTHVEAFSAARAATARRLRRAAVEKPQVTLFARASTQSLKQLLQSDQRADQSSSPLPAVLLVVSRSLALHQALNGWVVNDEIHLVDDVNIAVAVQAGQALLTPVIRFRGEPSLRQVHRDFVDVVERVRRDGMVPSDLIDATFTVTSLGSTRVEHFTPLVNPPQIAILGVGRSTNGLPLSLSFDHAGIDGAAAAAFLSEVVERLEAFRSEPETRQGDLR